MTPRNYEIVDCGAFCEVVFFYILPKNLFGDFFDSLSCYPQVRNLYLYTRFQMAILKKIIFTVSFLLTKIVVRLMMVAKIRVTGRRGKV